MWALFDASDALAMMEYDYDLNQGLIGAHDLSLLTTYHTMDRAVVNWSQYMLQSQYWMKTWNMWVPPRKMTSFYAHILYMEICRDGNESEKSGFRSEENVKMKEEIKKWNSWY
jgi:hypothetical protein